MLTHYTLHVHRNHGPSSETSLKASTTAVAQRKAEKIITSGTSPGDLRGASLHSKFGAVYLEFSRQDPTGGTVWEWRTLQRDLRPGHCGPCGLGFKAGSSRDLQARKAGPGTYLVMQKGAPVLVASSKRNFDTSWDHAADFYGEPLARISDWRPVKMFADVESALKRSGADTQGKLYYAALARAD